MHEGRVLKFDIYFYGDRWWVVLCVYPLPQQWICTPIQFKKDYPKFVRNIPDQVDGLSDAPNFPTSF
jgi:hypothetical protein